MATGSSEIWVSRKISFNTSRKLGVLVAISGVFCLAVSTLYLFMLLYPQIVFTGYIHGYLSLVDYELRYNTNGGSITLFNLDAVKMVAVATTGYVVILAIVTMFAMLYLRRNTLLSTSLIYGVSASLVVTSGVLRYLSQAFAIDAGILMSYANNGGVIKLRTLAGSIEYIGITAEKTFAYNLLFTHPLITLVLLYASIASSTASIMWLIYIYSKPSPSRREQNIKVKLTKPFWKNLTKMFALIVTITGIVLTYIGASVFTYYPSYITITPQPPPATFEAPPYGYTCAALMRTARGALAYTDFEAYPVPGWTSYGGAWELSAGGGFKGNALRGRDNNRGVGGVSSQYYWDTRIDGYSSLWVALRAKAEGPDGYKGIGLLNADRTRLYEASVSGGTAYIRRYDGRWTTLGSASIPNYVATRWYTLVLYYVDRGTSVDFSLWVYDDAGALVATLTARDTGATRFRPAYAGITINAVLGRWFRFDDFIVSTTDPRSVLFTDTQAGIQVEVWDNLENLVSSGTATGTSLVLGVVQDVVVGTGTDGRIVIKYPDMYTCGVLSVPTADAILGGDIYALSTETFMPALGANRTSASITVYISGSSSFITYTKFLRISTSQTLYARLLLDSISAPTTLKLDLWIEGVTRSTNITISNGIPVSTSTSIIQLNIGLTNNLTLAGYFTSTSQSATLNLRLELCTMPGNMGACVYYPIVLNLLS